MHAIVCMFCACFVHAIGFYMLHACRSLFGACVWLFLRVLPLLLLQLMLASARTCCLHAWARCVLLVGCDPPDGVITRVCIMIMPSRGVILVWSRSGGGSWVGVVFRGMLNWGLQRNVELGSGCGVVFTMSYCTIQMVFRQLRALKLSSGSVSSIGSD